MTTQAIRNKLETLRQQLPEFTDAMKVLVDNWGMELAKVERIEDSLKHPIIQEMVVEYQKKIKAINYRLSNERKMKESDRQSLFADKEASQIFVDTFDIGSRKESLYKAINEELKA